MDQPQKSSQSALAFQLVTELTSLVDETTFTKRMAVLRDIKDAWEKNIEVTVVTEEDSFGYGEQMHLDDADEVQMGPGDFNLDYFEEKPEYLRGRPDTEPLVDEEVGNKRGQVKEKKLSRAGTLQPGSFAKSVREDNGFDGKDTGNVSTPQSAGKTRPIGASPKRKTPTVLPRNFPCLFCSKQFMHEGHLKKHILKHSEDLSCKICGKKFSTVKAKSSHAKTHLNQNMSNTNPKKLQSQKQPKCPKSQSKAPQPTHLTPGTYTAQEEQIAHASTSNPPTSPGVNQYHGDTCEVKQEESNLTVTGGVVIEASPSSVSSKTHRSGIKQKYRCKYCSVSLSSSSRLLYHESLHLKDPLKIRKMGKKMPSGRHLPGPSQRQIQKKKFPKSMPAKRTMAPQKEDLFKCQYCRKLYFTRESSLNKHLNDMHPEMIPGLERTDAARPTGRKVVETLQIQNLKTEVSYASLTRKAAPANTPNASASPMYNTSSVQKGPKMAGTGQISNVAKAKKNLSPTVSGASTSQFQIANNAPKSHSQLVTSLGSPIRQTAQQKSPSMSDLRSPSKQKSHIKHSSKSSDAPSVSGTGNKQEKSYPCRYCDKVSKSRRLIIEHERQHTGERPYPCKCGKAFTSVSSLRNHQRRNCALRGQADSMPANSQQNYESRTVVTRVESSHVEEMRSRIESN
ncbi:zinc finger protein 37 homolog [Patiria miniata]|uniref:C2H2-type domain-containing protein n=1 Tax=Patiria miniata TaxID=46514 RepID=A0A914AG17_PATMI|nr:zinc finger protein 37 homolog [Patiria miniata]XP_038062916.1 zinc finger protein 37 homolog [Patiria miniata]